jgi:predicted Ser/Thr protein kinase
MGSPSSFKQWASQSSRGVASVVLPAGLEIGQRYRVKSLLGMGGMGAVYLVHDKGLDRDVALKLIRSDIAEDTEVLERFKREIQLSSRVTHPNVLRVFDLGESDGIKFLTMQFVDGRDLSTILKKQGKLPTERLLRVFRQAAEGLKAAHDQGVIHRDLKPQNIMINAADHVYVTDFGLAKSAEQSGMTQTGAVIGTPFYMSPEQVKGEPVGPQSDIFALGVILYQMAAGAVPWGGATPFEVMVARTQRAPKPIKELNPELPAYLQKIIERCLAVDLALRYQNVQEILEDLDAESFRTTIRYRTMSKRWVGPAIAAAGAALIIAAAGLWVYQKGRSAKPAAAQKTQSVLVADFANHTGDPVFDGTLEPAFTLALEGASFVSSYSRNSARKVGAQLSPGATGLDQTPGPARGRPRGDQRRDVGLGRQAGRWLRGVGPGRRRGDRQDDRRRPGEGLGQGGRPRRGGAPRGPGPRRPGRRDAAIDPAGRGRDVLRRIARGPHARRRPEPGGKATGTRRPTTTTTSAPTRRR